MRWFNFFVGLIILFTGCKKNNSANLNTSNLSANYNKNISGTWVVYQYQPESSTVILNKSDTLVFDVNSNYTYNNTAAKYYLDNFNTYNNYRLIIYGTAFGDLTAIIPGNFETTKEINGILFSPYRSSNSNNKGYLLWFKKI